MNKSILQIGLVISVIIGMTSCVEDNTESQEAWVQNEVNKRIESYRAERLEECMDQVFAKAEMKIDSLLSGKDLYESVVNNQIPDKPTKPNYIPLDTSALENHNVEHVIHN